MSTNRIVYIQVGDFRNTLDRFEQGLNSTYQNQKESVDFVIEQAKNNDTVGVICTHPENGEYDLCVRENISLAALDYWHAPGAKDKLISMLEELKPTHVILRTVVLPVIDWCTQNSVSVFPIFADSFHPPKGLKQKIKYVFYKRQLISALSNNAVAWLSNHNVGACQSIVDLGITPDKVVPWDWPRANTPEQYPVKTLPSEQAQSKSINFFYAGSISEDKGVGDILRAVKQLKEQGINFHLKLAGNGDIDKFQQTASSLGVADDVTFLGIIPNSDVITYMQESTIVLVPSHHEYPEGLPGTIYEALATRTPIVISDHPMFTHYLKSGDGVEIVAEKSPDLLAKAISKLITNPELYQTFSEKTLDSFYLIAHANHWYDVVNNWLLNPNKDNTWLKDRRLSLES